MLSNFDPKGFFSIVAASYGKRLLEKPYDQLSQTEFFQKLKDQPALLKSLLEAASYALTALFEQNANDGTPIKRAINEVLMDIGPELSKRMLNGDTSPIEIKAEKYTAMVQKPSEKLFVQVLLEKLDLEKVTRLAAWMNTATPQEKSDILKYIRGLDADKVVEVGQLSTKAAGELFTAFEEPTIEKPKKETALDVLERRLRDYRDSLVKQKRGG
jgi:hypothetical protein